MEFLQLKCRIEKSLNEGIESEEENDSDGEALKASAGR